MLYAALDVTAFLETVLLHKEKNETFEVNPKV